MAGYTDAEKIISLENLKDYTGVIKTMIPDIEAGSNITLELNPEQPNKVKINAKNDIQEVDAELSETSLNPVQNKKVTQEFNLLSQSIQTLEDKYDTFFDNISVNGSTLKIGSETVASVTGTTLHINEKR